jgi:hypothetical protein
LGELLSLLVTGAAVGKVPDATRPAMVLGHWLERRVFGLSAWGYHLNSLLLYALVTALATSVAFSIARRREVAFFAGCFFALAPIHAEPVASINYREDLLATAGMLGTLLCLCAPRRADVSSVFDDGGVRALGAAALLAFGLFAKESALAVLPLLGLLIWHLPWARERVLRRRRMCWALAGAVIVWMVWRVPLALQGDDVPLAPSRPLLQTLLRTARFEVQAVRYALMPWSYSPDHWRQPDAGFGWVGPFFSLLVGVAVLGRERRLRAPAVGVGLALAAPLACCPLLRPINEYADRYFFLGVLGGGLFWGWLALRLAQAWTPARRRWLVLALVPLLPVAFRATALWKNERTLWTAAVELSPNSPRAWASLSRVHRRAGEREAADMTIARALTANADYGPALVTQIYNELAFGRLAEARAHVEEMESRGRDRETGLAKAARCAKLEAAEAARCIGP